MKRRSRIKPVSDKRRAEKVWFYESEDWPENRMVNGAWRSLDGAVDALKAVYAPPYVVHWEELTTDDDGPAITGHFAQVIHYHIGGTYTYHFYTMELND